MVELGRHAELLTAGPHRVVVEVGVVGERVDPTGARHRLGAGDRPQDRTVHHHGLQPELDDGVIERGERLGRGVHGDDRDGLHPVAMATADLREVAVVGTRDPDPQLVVGRAEQAERAGAEQQGEVDAELIEPLVQQVGHDGRRPVEGVRRRNPPPGVPERPGAASLLDRQVAKAGSAAHRLVVPLGDGLTRLFDEQVAHDRRELDQVPVAIDDRMVDLVADRVDGARSFEVHGPR